MAHVLARQYELITLIGRGPTGEVWRATDRITRATVAVKVLDARLGADPDTVDRFQRERQVLTAFLHPAYVRVRDVVTDDGILALVMEYVTGWDLRRFLDQSGPLPVGTAAEITAMLAEALATAHDVGVVHCEVKPTNVLLDDASGEARLTDCRVARLARGYTGPAAWYADPAYAAPEVIRGGPAVPASDVYGLGVLLHEMLAGTVPYHGLDGEVLAAHLHGDQVPPPPPIPGVPPYLADLIEACLRGDPAARPTAFEVAARLRTQPAVAFQPPAMRAPTGEHMPVRTEAVPAPMRPPGRRSAPRGLVIIGILAALAAAVLVAIVYLSGGEDGRPAGANVPASTSPVSELSGPPVPPASASPETTAGAMAFASYWFDALSYAVATGDTATLDAASSPQCKVCLDASELVHKVYRDGATFNGGVYAVRRLQVDDFQPVSHPAVRIVFDRSPRSIVEANGGQGDVLPGGGFLTCTLLLERVDGHWTVLDVQSPAPLF
jgi:hypothetical protein